MAYRWKISEYYNGEVKENIKKGGNLLQWDLQKVKLPCEEKTWYPQATVNQYGRVMFLKVVFVLFCLVLFAYCVSHMTFSLIETQIHYFPASHIYIYSDWTSGCEVVLKSGSALLLLPLQCMLSIQRQTHTPWHIPAHTEPSKSFESALYKLSIL